MSSQPKTTARSVGKELSDKERSNVKVFEREAKENSMKTVTIKIEGMMCPHCSGRVKSLLEERTEVASADVSHERGDAVITLSSDVETSVLEEIITAAGYKVV